MNVLKMLRNMICIPMMLCGLVMFIGAGVTLSHQKHWVRTDAVIRSVSHDYDSDGDREYTVLVDYQTEDGDDYRGINLRNYESDYEEGRQIAICFDPDDPTNIVVNSRSLPRSLCICGSIVMAAAIGVWIYFQKTMK